VNGVGEGEASPPSGVIELPQQPPSGSPRGLVGSPRSNSSILLQWQSPDTDRWNGQILGYTLRYKPSGYPDTTTTTQNIPFQDSVMLELTGLIVFQEYEISVTSYNQKGVGPYGQSVLVRTLEGRPTAPPLDVSVTTVSSTVVNITWSPPNPQYINGINQGYHIRALAADNSTSDVSMTVLSNTLNMLGVQRATMTGLSKYAVYAFMVACFTAQGDGPASPTLVTRTFQDVPDQVSSLTFSTVMDTSLVVNWTPPFNPNGNLTGYTLNYSRKTPGASKITVGLGPGLTNYTITSLTATTVYTIDVSAMTSVGVGPSRSADIQSGITPERPAAPTALAVTNILARSAQLLFTPGFNGYTSISQWIFYGQVDHVESNDTWTVVYAASAPDANSIEVVNLQPFRWYRLRLTAVNMAGRSDPSGPTAWFMTNQAVPSAPPADLSVRAINETSIRVQWTPLAGDQWNGQGRMYSVQWKLHGEADFAFALSVPDENVNYCVVTRLSPYTTYDVRVAAVNNVGASFYSAVMSERTRESVPSSGPARVIAVAINSTIVSVSWGAVPKAFQNGVVLGYRVVYRVTAAVSSIVISVNCGNFSQCNLSGLFKFVSYQVQVLAYTSVGSGALSLPTVTVTTLEDIPGPPVGAYFPVVTETTVQLVWSPPLQPNGVIIGYRVAYGVRSNVQTYVNVNDTSDVVSRSYRVTSLAANFYYAFSVTARTRLGLGQPALLEVYTVSNRRVPDPPSRPMVGASQRGDRWIVMNWTPGGDGYGPIRNYTIQVNEKDGVFTRIGDYIPSSTTAYNATGLRPNQLYRFQVQETYFCSE